MTLLSLHNSITASLNSSINQTRERITEVSTEAVTGRRADLVGHLNGSIGEALQSEHLVESITAEREQLQIRETRLDIVQNSLTFVQDTTSGISTRLEAALGRGDTAALDFSAHEAESAIELVFNSLNVRVGDRFLFSGDATSTIPFPDAEQLLSDIQAIAATAPDAASFETQIDDYFDSPTGPYQQGVYSGSQNISDNDAINALDPALTELVKGLSVLSLGQASFNFAVIDNNPTLLANASATLLTATAGVTNLRANEGLKQEQIERSLSTLNLEEGILTEAFDNLTGRDQFEAASELTLLETNLEASYLLTSRLSDLQILNFIR